ncbi:MAG: EAL domain-containing protein, partial [Salinibacterium sp.]|nr:EAL domain-containing protein [Salinibacterium sp.]
MTTLEVDLRGAVGRGEISAWFQAQHDVITGQIVAVEALCRWHHPELGLIEPSVFIALAEKSDLIQEIGQFMVEQSWAAAAEWSHSDRHIEVSVNVSPAQLVTSEFTDRLAHELDRLSLSPLSLSIEITESLPIADVPAVVQRLDELRRLG